MRDLLETERLLLRPFRPEDVEVAFSWLGDVEVMRYMPAGPDTSLGQTISRLVAYREHQLVYGYSKWLVSERESGEAVGDAGLLWLPGAEDIDLGFRFVKRCWGRGYATEVARAWIDYAFSTLSLHRLTAFAHPENSASLRVLERVGFRRLGPARIRNMVAITYMLDRESSKRPGAK